MAEADDTPEHEDESADVLYSSPDGMFEIVVGDYGRGRQEMEAQTWAPKPDEPDISMLVESYTFPTISDAIGAAVAILDRFSPHRLRR